MKEIVFIIILALSALPARAQMLGVDYLGGAKYCDALISAHPNGWAAGFFLDTFGAADECAGRLASTGKAPLIRIHLSWDDAHAYKNFLSAAKKAPRVNALAARFPNVKWYVSGATEHKLNKKDTQKLADAVSKNAPLATYVNNSLVNVDLPNTVNEVHGGNPHRPGGQFIVSMDGTSIDDIDVASWKSRYRDAEVLFVWDWQLNLKKNKNDKTPRPQRKIRPSAQYIQNLIAKFQTSNAPINVPPATVGLNKMCANSINPVGTIGLWKPASQDSGPPREGKPAFISKRSGEKKSLSVLNANGGQIATIGYYGSYGAGSRYYSGWKGGSGYSGQEIQKKAMKTSGAEVTYLRWGRGCIGPFLATQRTGGL